MKRSFQSWSALIMLTGCLAICSCASDGAKREDVMFWDLPAPVQKTFGERFPGAHLDYIQRLTWKDGIVWYELSFTFHEASRKILLTSEGQTPDKK